LSRYKPHQLYLQQLTNARGMVVVGNTFNSVTVLSPSRSLLVEINISKLIM
jgi:hypothetical protein